MAEPAKINVRALMDSSDLQRPAPVDPPAPALMSKFIDWDEFWSKDRTEVEWLHDEVLARGRGHSIYAKHGTGKSLFSLWVSVEMVKAGHVVIYADWEMSEDDLYERLSDMGHGPGTDLSRLRYLMLPDLAPLNTHQGAQQMGSLVDDAMLSWPEKDVAVVIDTISRAVEGEENSNDTIQGFYRHTGLELKRRGVTWVRLDHAGHDGEHARGASAKGDDVDVVWRLSTTDDGIQLKADKRRMGWVPEKVNFAIKTSPVLKYEPVAGSWPAGTQDVARLLDELAVPLEAGMRASMTALREAGKGRRGVIVTAAQRYRRMVEASRVEGRNLTKTPTGHTSGHAGHTPPENGGTHPGHTDEIPHSHGADTPPDTPGHTSAADWDTEPPLRSRGSVPGLDDDEDYPTGPRNSGSNAR